MIDTETQPQFNAKNNEKYKVKAIQNNIVFTKNKN